MFVCMPALLELLTGLGLVIQHIFEAKLFILLFTNESGAKYNTNYML